MKPNQRACLTSLFAIGVAIAGCADVDEDDVGIAPPRAVVTNAANTSPTQAQTEPALDPATEAPTPGDAATDTVAVAHLQPRAGVDGNKASGYVYFAPTSSGIELTGRLLHIEQGKHGIHIHENGDCADPGEHFAPDDTAHGDPRRGEHHLGDLGNLEADPANEAWVSINVDGLALKGERSVLGKALVVHVGADDLRSQPSGNSGDVLACGIIEPHDDAQVRPENAVSDATRAEATHEGSHK
jgi:Cu-Zn family superoxide dismutase